MGGFGPLKIVEAGAGLLGASGAGLLGAETNRFLWGNAEHRPNCKKDPIGSYFCDMQHTFTPIDCRYTPLIIGGIIWVGSYMVLRSWRVPTILGSAYTAYAYSPLADGDEQDKKACRNEGVAKQVGSVLKQEGDWIKHLFGG